AHQENKIMNKALEEKFETEKPDGAFENRMLTNFRNQVPERAGIIKILAGLMRSRATQIAAVAAVLLALVQVGRMITGEGRGMLDARLAMQRERSEQDGELVTLGKPGIKSPSASLAKHKQLYNFGDLSPRGGVAGLSSVPEPAAPPVSGSPEQGRDKTDITRLGVRTPTDLALKLRSAKPAQSEGQTITGGAEKTEESPVDAYRRDDSESAAASTSNPALANHKLIRNATVNLEVVKFDEAVQKITAFASEEKGYVATTSSEKQE